MLRGADGRDGPRGRAAPAAAPVLPRWEEEGSLTPVWVGLASGIVALAISRGQVFGSLRARLTGWRAYLAECPLCLSFWVSLVFTAVQGAPAGLEFCISWWASWGIGALLAFAVDRLAGE